MGLIRPLSCPRDDHWITRSKIFTKFSWKNPPVSIFFLETKAGLDSTHVKPTSRLWCIRWWGGSDGPLFTCSVWVVRNHTAAQLNRQTPTVEGSWAWEGRGGATLQPRCAASRPSSAPSVGLTAAKCYNGPLVVNELILIRLLSWSCGRQLCGAKETPRSTNPYQPYQWRRGPVFSAAALIAQLQEFLCPIYDSVSCIHTSPFFSPPQRKSRWSAQPRLFTL